MPSEMQWGVLDTDVNCWIGDESGPRLFDDENLARVSAAMLTKQMGLDYYAGPVRFRAEPYDAPATKKRDDLTLVRGPDGIIAELERGR